MAVVRMVLMLTAMMMMMVLLMVMLMMMMMLTTMMMMVVVEVVMTITVRIFPSVASCAMDVGESQRSWHPLTSIPFHPSHAFLPAPGPITQMGTLAMEPVAGAAPSSMELAGVAGEDPAVVGLDYRADGRVLAAACSDGCVRLFDVRTARGQVLGWVAGRGGSSCAALRFGAAEKTMFTLSGDGIIEVGDGCLELQDPPPPLPPHTHPATQGRKLRSREASRDASC